MRLDPFLEDMPTDDVDSFFAEVEGPIPEDLELEFSRMVSKLLTNERGRVFLATMREHFGVMDTLRPKTNAPDQPIDPVVYWINEGQKRAYWWIIYWLRKANQRKEGNE